MTPFDPKSKDGQPRRVSLEAQGSVLKASVDPPRSKREHSGGGPRGRVYEFSKASRKRLIEKCARLDPKPPDGHRWLGSFITVTYPGPEADLPTVDQVKDHGRAFRERLRRAFPKASAVIRLQFDSAGARDYHPHFHFVAFGLPYVDKDWLEATWADVIGADPGNATQIRALWSMRQALAYVSDYVASEGGGLVHLAYPHAGIDEETGEVVGDVNEEGLVWIGRVWFEHNKAYLPYADLIQLSIILDSWFYDLKRDARKVWSLVNDHAWAGFSLFVEEPERWIELALYYAQG